MGREINSRFWIALFVLIACSIPFIFNAYGIDFSSKSQSVEDLYGHSQNPSVDDVFPVLQGAIHHALLEWSGVCIAFLASFSCFVHYGVRRDITVVIIGMAFFCAGLVDTFHTLAALRFIEAATPNTDFIPFTWALSRIFHAFILICGVCICLWLTRQAEGGGSKNQLQVQRWNNKRSILVIGGVFIGLTFLAAYITAVSDALPQTMYPDDVISRPFDLLPLALFTFSGILFWIWYQQTPSLIKFALVLSTIPEVFTQLCMTFGSTELFDNYFNIAHALKVVAYSIVFIGVLLELVGQKGVLASNAHGLLNPHSDKSSIGPQEDMLDIGRASRPLGLQIPVAAFLLAVSVAIVVSFSFYFESERLVKKQEQHNLEVESNVVGPFVFQLYKRASSDVLFLSRTPPSLGISESTRLNDDINKQLWVQRLTKIFTEMLTTNPAYDQIRYVAANNGGEELVNVIRGEGIKSVDVPRLINAHETPYLDRISALKPGEVYFTKLDIGHSIEEVTNSHSLKVTVATSVYDAETHQLFGHVILDFDLGEFLYELSDASLSGVSFYLANTDGKLLFHSKKQPGVAVPEHDYLQEVYPELTATFDQDDIKATAFDSLKNQSVEGFSSYLKTIDLSRYGSDHSVVMLLQHDNYTSQREMASFRNRSVLLGVSMALGALALAVLGSRRVVQPIVAMSQAVEVYEQTGRLENLPIKSDDEMGVLARSFNNLIIRIDQALQAQNLATEQAEESSARLQGILDSAADAILTIDAQGRILSFNTAAKDMFGYRETEVLGRSVNMLMPSKYAEKHDEYMSAYDQSGISKIMGVGRELEAMKKSGEVFDIHLAITEVVTSEGTIYTGLIRDITASKAAEKALVQAKESAESAARYKSEFLASMSHEIRTPMNGVLGMLGLLHKGELTDEQRHQVQLALSSGESLLTLINDILDFSKVEAGKLELEIIDFDLRTLFGEFSETIAHKVQEKGLELILDLTQVKHSMVKGDPGRIRQVLTNLVGNAIKFTEQGEIIIRAELLEERDGSFCLYCSVEDTGIGIPKNKIEGLFESFTQVDASTTRKYGGTGLGLAISSQLCRLMRGNIEAFSDQGKGSCFQFYIALQASQLSQQVIPDVSLAEVPMLIVDDNQTNRYVLRNQLELWGADVTEVENAEQAMDILQQEIDDTGTTCFKVAFLDMYMPNMDGAELGTWIRQQPGLSDLKLVVMTSVSQRGDAKAFAEIGFSAYFPKPATTSALFDALAVVLGGGDALEHASPLVTQHYLKELDRNQKGSNELEKEVSSEEDKATSATPPTEQTAHSEVTAENTEAAPNWPDNAKILLVEDNYINQAVASGLLESMGLVCDVAANGVEAIEALNTSIGTESYALILMDCQMPEMDGYEATKNIRNGMAPESYRDITIVAMTANAMKGDKEKCINAGMNDYLSKPVDADALQAMLAKWLVDRDLSNSPPV